jgi:hypothetical protein
MEWNIKTSRNRSRGFYIALQKQKKRLEKAYSLLDASVYSSEEEPSVFPSGAPSAADASPSRATFRAKIPAIFKL